MWMDAVRAAGIDKQAAIIASVLPLTGVEQAQVSTRGALMAPYRQASSRG